LCKKNKSQGKGEEVRIFARDFTQPASKGGGGGKDQNCTLKTTTIPKKKEMELRQQTTSIQKIRGKKMEKTLKNSVKEAEGSPSSNKKTERRFSEG